MDLLLILSIIISSAASLFINSNYKKYRKVRVASGKTGYDVAREILDKNGLKEVLVLETEGELTDHYDPSKKVVKLSTDIYHSSTIASTSVAAHECGHAIQDKENYSMLRLRASLVPIVNLSTKIGYVAILIGILANSVKLFNIGILMEALMLLFQLVTLPVEFNASSRALKKIEDYNLVSKDEKKGCRKMLTSAALTYVASVVTTLIQIFRLVLVSRSSRR